MPATTFVGGGTTYSVGKAQVVNGFNLRTDVLDLGATSIHGQIPVDTPDGLMIMNMFNSSQSLLLKGIKLADLHPQNFAPISDAHLQQDLSAALAYEDGTGLVRPNTVYIRSHEKGLEEVVDFDPATDKISFFYLSVRGDGGLNFSVEDTAEGARFFSPLTGQSLTLRGVSFSDLDSSHFEWRANQLEDNIAGRMGLEAVIEDFSYVRENIFTGKSVAMAGGVDRAPYHSVQGYEEYTGTPVGNDSGKSGTDDDSQPDGNSTGALDDEQDPIVVTVTGGSVTEGNPGKVHKHEDGSSHVHDDGHRYITFTVSLDAPAKEEFTLNYATKDGSAAADTTSKKAWDYHSATGKLIFKEGEQTKTVAVSVHPDKLVEQTETFTFAVSGDNITGALEARGKIWDDDVKTLASGDDDRNLPAGERDGSDALDANIRVQTDWGDGAQIVLQITNTDQFVFNGGWEVELDLDPDLVEEGWNGNWSRARNGDGISVSDVGWNGTLQPGQTVEVGFNLNEGGINQAHLNQEADFMFV